MAKKVIDVDEDCNITYSDGSIEICPYRPAMTFEDCDPGYGSHGSCEKWNFYHRLTRSVGGKDP